eukprot:TRINITY_DN3607_c0_g1_i3.p2 TRINITY_DN3607_c0_g1~~TRINITY_DN3607_c0_g1_i3.p2  ORF type:complete len:213 (+),score=21.91 TRINITY_DN3607_c0_g1_i3:119-757(+)
MAHVCPACGCKETEDVDDSDVMCLDCGESWSKEAAAPGTERFFKVGVVQSADKVAGKDKLTVLKIDVGAGDPVPVVTNAPNVKEGSRIVVALVGATIGDPEDGEKVTKSTVGGVKSEGMVCDASMLNWGSANKGRAVILPDSCPVGSAPPAEKPRGDKQTPRERSSVAPHPYAKQGSSSCVVSAMAVLCLQSAMPEHVPCSCMQINVSIGIV